MRVTLWFMLWTVFQAPALVQSQDDSAEDQNLIYAQRHFMRGRDAFKSQDYETALAAFQASLRLFASPNTRLYLARSLAALERFTEAANTYEEVMQSARLKEDIEPSYGAAGSAAERELTNLRNRLALLSVSFENGGNLAHLKVNGTEVPPEAVGLPVYVRPGTVTVEVRYTDGHEQNQQVRISAKERKTVVFNRAEPEKTTNVGTASAPPVDDVLSDEPTEADGSSSAAAIGLGVGAGVAIIGWGSAIAFGLLADGRYSDLEMQCGGSCPAARNDEIEEGEMYQTLANTGLIVGAVGTLAAGVALVLLLSDEETTNTAATRKPEGFSVGPTGVSVRW